MMSRTIRRNLNLPRVPLIKQVNKVHKVKKKILARKAKHKKEVINWDE